jgi:DNA-binding transcriptional ArsR family regulator
MFENLITSKTRLKILLKFFLNQQIVSHLRGLEAEFGESSNSIRLELLKLENAGLLSSEVKGNKKMYFANTNYPFFSEINNILKKTVGIDEIIKQITSQIGNLQAAYLTGDFAIGKDSKIIDMALIGNHLDQTYIDTLVNKAENLISRRIQYIVLNKEEMIELYSNKPILLIWNSDAIIA